MKIQVKKDGWHLVPANQEALEYIKKMSKDTEYSVDVTKTRNAKFHRKYFAMLSIGHANTRLVYEITAETISAEDYRKTMQRQAGFVRVSLDEKGNKYINDESISFAKMTEDRFQEVYEKVKQEVLRDIGCTDQELEEQIAIEF